MFEAELAGTDVFLVVAQRPFEAENEAGIVNVFSTLKPLMFEDGTRAEAEQFPASGEVWWMLAPTSRGLAEPGRVLRATLERGRHSGMPGKSWYQVRIDSVKTPRPGDLIEVIAVPPEWAVEERDLIARSHAWTLDHPPLDLAYVSWQGHLYGPLRTEAEPGDDGKWRVRFLTANAEHTVRKLPIAELQRLAANAQLKAQLDVSCTDRPLYQGGMPHTCRYHLLQARPFDQATASAARVTLESDEAVIKRAAKSFFNRSKRQQLGALLAEVLGDLESGTEVVTPGAVQVIRSLRSRMEEEENAAKELARALLQDGVLGERLQEALGRAEQEHIEKHAARLQTQIDEKLREVRKALDAVEKKRDAQQQALDQQRRERLAAIEKEAVAKLAEADKACREREEKLEAEKRELARQRELLSMNLAKVAEQLATNRDGLVNQFLAISPLLEQLHLLPGRAGTEVAPAAATAGPAAAPRAGKSFALPAFIASGGPAEAVSEEQFFERFCRHVEESGFRYRRLDLAGFHLSVKCNDLSVLGGLPGTGKSSLPRLYAEALAGAECQTRADRFLNVGVSPSWLDMRDLLGNTNALDRCFQPAECGLYQFLIAAQEEDARRGSDSRLYLICLDEMNLAQVEHYFSGFLQALERPDGQREVHCFAAELVATSDPFASWPVLNLPRGVRFVGTVNFDETTRQLSQRVLDRVNLIRLKPNYLLDVKEPGQARPAGPPISVRNFRDWVAPSAGIERSLGELLDQLKEPLAQLGCPLNPRRFRAIRRLLGSTPPALLKAEQALDLQIAYRILPQVRNLFRPGMKEALDAVRRVLAAHPSGFPEALELLQELQASEFSGALFASGGEE